MERTTINHLRLDRLTLKYFRGIEHFVLEPKGKSINIISDNYKGKSTLASAATYLITGRDTQDRMPDSFGIKTREVLPDGSLGEEIHGLEHVVEGVLRIGDKPLTLKKVYTEDWTTPRGSSKEQLTGHTIQHHWDGEPNVKASVFAERLEEFITQEEYKILSLPDYFASQMHWQSRRAVLSEMAGEVTDEDVVDANPQLHRYPELLDGKTQKAVENTLNERKKNLNEELGTKRNPGNIAARIDEHLELIEDVEGVEEARKRVEELKETKQALEAELSDLKSGGGISELRVKIQDIEAEKAELKTAHQQQIDESLQGRRDKVEDLQDKVDETTKEYREAKREYEAAEADLKNKREIIAETEQEIEYIKSRTFTPPEDDTPDVCPYCDRPMEKDSEHDHDKMEEEFNARRAADLKEGKEELSKLQSEAEAVLSKVEQAEQTVAKVKGRLNQREEALQKAQSSLNEAKGNQQGVESTEDWAELESQQEALQKKIDNAQAEKQEQVSAKKAEISKFEGQIEEASRVIHQAETNKKYRDRIQELKNLRRQYAEELEQIEEDLALIDDFKRAEAQLIEKNVNDKFEHVSWQMFEYYISGGFKEVCNAVYKSRPFDILSTSEKIFAGIDIINTLSKHFGKSVPVWIDNRESVGEIPDNDLQIINLVYNPEYEKLTVEPVKESEPVTV